MRVLLLGRRLLLLLLLLDDPGHSCRGLASVQDPGGAGSSGTAWRGASAQPDLPQVRPGRH